MNDESRVNGQLESAAAINSNPESPVVAMEAVVSAGAQLAALREARSWTTQQIASQLNLADRQIQALEADNYAALPGIAIVRGFIRAYAKILQADPAPILAAIVGDAAAPVALPPEKNTLSTSFTETKLSYAGTRGVSPKVRLAIAGVVLIGGAVFAGQYFGLPSSSSQKSQKVEEKLASIETAEVVELAPVEIIESKMEPVATAAAQVVLVPTATSVPITPVLESKNVVLQPKPAAVTPVAPASAAPVLAAVEANGKDALLIKVREDSWVEIKREDNSLLLSRLLKAGTSEVVAVTDPVNVVIGNAAGVDVTLRGKSIDVVTGNSSNVARLNLK